MLHFNFSDTDNRYLFLKCDFTEDEYYEEYERDVKKYVRHHVFDGLKKHINLVDPICYLPTYSGPHFTQDFIWDYIQPSGNRILWCSIGLWQVIYKFCKEHNIPYDGLDPNRFKRKMQHTIEEFKEIVDSWRSRSTGSDYSSSKERGILCSIMRLDDNKSRDKICG